MQILQILNEFNIVSILFRLTLSLIIGGLIGIDREQSTRSAGFRTYALVCLGSTLVMLIGNYTYINFDSVNINISRLGAQVISGIGFLGAGAIINSGKQKVRGLTTAAALWTCACIGLALGIGFYSGAIITFLFTLTLLRVLRIVDTKYREKFHFVDIYLELHTVDGINNVLKFLNTNDINLITFSSVSPKVATNCIGLNITIKVNKIQDSNEIISYLYDIEKVDFIHKVYI